MNFIGRSESQQPDTKQSHHFDSARHNHSLSTTLKPKSVTPPHPSHIDTSASNRKQMLDAKTARSVKTSNTFVHSNREREEKDYLRPNTHASTTTNHLSVIATKNAPSADTKTGRPLSLGNLEIDSDHTKTKKTPPS